MRLSWHDGVGEGEGEEGKESDKDEKMHVGGSTLNLFGLTLLLVV